MALQHLRSSTADKRPTPGAMSDGQLAMNTNLVSPGLFLKDSNGDLVKVGPVHVGTTAPNATPGAGGQAGNSKGEQWLDTSSSRYVFKIWDGTAWRTEDGEFVNVSGDTMTGALGIIAGSAAAPGVFFSGDTNTGIYSPGADQLAVATNGTGRLFIDASGNVGVGAASSGDALHIRSASTTQLRLTSTSGSLAGIVFDPNGTSFASFIGATAQDIVSYTSGTERLRITSAGLVGVGTSSPGFPLHVVTSGNSGLAVYTGTSSANQIYLGNTAGESVVGTLSNQNFGIVTNGGQKVTVTTGGNVGVGTTGPTDTLTVNGGIDIFDDYSINLGSNQGGGAVIKYNTDGNLNIAPRTSYSTVFLSAPGGTERARIDSSGNVGIGTSTPGRELHISGAGTSGTQLQVQGTSASAGIKFIPSSGDNWEIQTSTANDFLVYNRTDDATRFVINGSGNVGIGTTGPATQFAVQNASTSLGIEVDTTSGFASGPTIRGYYRAGSAYTTLGLTGSQVAFGINDVEKARLDASGRLLVGTSSAPSAGSYNQFGKLVVQGNTFSASTTSVLSLNRGEGAASIISGEELGVVVFGDSAGNEFGSIQCVADAAAGSGDYPGRLVFSTTADGASGPTERMRIGQNGTVNIGTATSIYLARLTCVSSSGLSASAFSTDTSSEYGTILRNSATSGNNGFALFETEPTPTTRGSITYNRGGGVVAYNTTSDYRAKTLLGAVKNPGETIDALKVYRGVMNGATVERPMLVAHEAQEVAPYCVTGDKDAVDKDGYPIYQQMDHQVLVPLLIAEIQQLRARVAALETA